MNTSYFRKSGTHPNAISIALCSPDFYKGPEYRPLAPPNWLLQKYHQDHDKDYYIGIYMELILNRLDPKRVYKDLGPKAVMLCWEKSGSFCHRYLVADWLVNNLGIEVTEL